MSGWVDFAAVKRAVSLETVLRHYQVPGLRRRRNRIEGQCPIHRGQRDDSFRVDLDKNVFHCFSCQAGGNVLAFVAAMERCSIREAALRLPAVVPDRRTGPIMGAGKYSTGSEKRRFQSSAALRSDGGESCARVSRRARNRPDYCGGGWGRILRSTRSDERAHRDTDSQWAL